MLGNSYGSKNNGVQLNVVNKSVLLSLIWLLLSLSVVFYGIWHCRTSSYSYYLSCEPISCRYESSNREGKESLVIYRQDIKSVTLVRLANRGKILPETEKPVGRNGHSISILYNHQPDIGGRLKIEKLLLFSNEVLNRFDSSQRPDLKVIYTIYLSLGYGSKIKQKFLSYIGFLR